MSEPTGDPIDVAQQFHAENRPLPERLMDAVRQRDAVMLEGAVLEMDRETLLAMDAMLLPLQHLLSRRLHVIVEELAAHEARIEAQEKTADG